jgi:type I restriction enzyme S subunit
MKATEKAFVFSDDESDVILSTGFAVLRPIPSLLHSRFLLHWLRTLDFNDQKDLLCTGATQQAITNEKLATLTIPLPLLPEQRRIVDILDQLDDLRVKRGIAVGQLDTLTQSIFLDLFENRDSVTWNTRPLDSCYWFQEGPGVRHWQFTDRGVKLLNVGNIEKTGFLNLGKTDKYLAEQEAYGKYKHFLVDAGDLVIASSGISFDQDGMLRTRGAFVQAEHLPLCMNTSTIRFKALEGISDLRFLWVWLGSSEFRSQITRRVTGSAQQNFGPSHLKSLIITLPPLPVQERFATQVEAIGQLRSLQQIQRDDLDALFASVQYRAFRGEL